MRKIPLNAAILLAAFSLVGGSQAQGTAFTYQGRLGSGGAPVSGDFDFTFALYDSANPPGNLVAGTLTNSAVPVTNGLFSASIDFGSRTFPGAVWLQIGVRASGSGNFTGLDPRQELSPAPSSVSAQGLQPDLRPITNADLKHVIVPQNTAFSVMTNNGPMTITSIHVAWIAEANYPGPILTIYADGQRSDCQLYSFYAAQGNPPFFKGDTIDWDPDFVQPGFVALAGFRQVNINCKSNAGVCLTFPTTNNTIYTDVWGKLGAPLTPWSWHLVETQTLLSPGAFFTPLSVAGSRVQLESVSMFELSSGGVGWLESRPVFSVDGAMIFGNNGNEDFFGDSFFFGAGAHVYATPQWGSASENNLPYKFGFTDGCMSYRFFKDFYASNSLSLFFTNVWTNSMSNDCVVTYFTSP